MSEGMWSTSCLFYFMASLKDIKHAFIPEFNKNKIILAKIGLLPRPLLNREMGATGGGTAAFPLEFFILRRVD